MELDALISALPQLADGLKITLGLTILSLIIASILGILMAMGRSYAKPPLSLFIIVYEKVFRGIPLLVIFFLIYFGLGQIGLNLEAFYAAILGLALRSAAYQAQIFRSAINSIPQGQTDAALSIGMSKLKTIRHVVLPQILRLSIPGWSNEFTIVLKDTSIAFGIGVIELMRQGRYVYVRNPDLVLPVLLFIALIYFILVISANRGLGYLEKKYKISGLETGAVK